MICQYKSYVFNIRCFLEASSVYEVAPITTGLIFSTNNGIITLMPNYFGYQLKAVGNQAIPLAISFRGQMYRRQAVFKHDFFAATCLYEAVDRAEQSKAEGLPDKIVLKIARKADFAGLPLAWLGRALCRHEVSILQRLKGINGIPRLLGAMGKTGLIYEYIEGSSLNEHTQVSDTYFSELFEILTQIHQRRIAYMDMNKRGNLLVGAEGRPYLIDYQISCYIPKSGKLLRWLTDGIMHQLQREDIYHMLKHKRRIRKDLLTEEEQACSRRTSFLIRLHRVITRPWTYLRRGLLDYFYRTNRLIVNDTSKCTGENNPSRWARSLSNWANF